MFETFIVQPIFNLLVFLYAVAGDFGTAIILFTIISRFALWPLLRKQLHQGRLMRNMQPEIKEIRKRNKGNRPQESAEMMELYKKHGVSPFSSFGLLFVQLPIFFGLFAALRALIDNPDRILRLPYSFVRERQAVQDMLQDIADKTNQAVAAVTDPNLQQQLTEKLGSSVSIESLENLPKEEVQELFSTTLISHTNSVDGSIVNGPVSAGFQGASESLVQGPFFEQQLFGIVDLSGQAFANGQVYIPVLIIAVLAGVFQYFQTKQMMPRKSGTKSIRQILRDSADKGEEPDQGEVNAAVGGSMTYLFPPLITIISATSPSGLALYFATSGLVGLIQQRTVLRQDLDEMELVADVTEIKPTKEKTVKVKKETKNESKTSSKKSGKKSKKRKR